MDINEDTNTNNVYTKTNNLKRKANDTNYINDDIQKESNETKKQHIFFGDNSTHPEMALNKRGIESFFKINVENINKKTIELIKDIDFDTFPTDKLHELDMEYKKIIIECTNLSFNFLNKIKNEKI